MQIELLPKALSETAADFAKKHYERVGILHSTNTGYAYIRVIDNFITELLPFLQRQSQGLEGFEPASLKIGAHISVFYEEDNPPDVIEEEGQKFTFEVEDLFIGLTEEKAYLAIRINSPDIANLRQKYGLSPTQLNFRGLIVPLHLTIGTKRLLGSVIQNEKG